jgi:hypothetical protein
MARMRCYSPRTGHDHGTGVAGLALPLASGPAARRIGILLGAFPARAARTVGAAWLRPDPAEPGRPPVPPEPRPPTRANTANVLASTSPAEVTVVPVAPSARLTASRSEASRTPGRRWGSCRLVGRRWSSEVTFSQCPGYQEVGFSKYPARSLIIQMAPSGVTPVRGAPGGAQERAPPVSPSSLGRWGTLANVIRGSGRYRSEPCR